jgi:nucleoside-diphosphate-sugar epimerase
MKRVIVTGGTGFVGANLTRRLLRDGHEVHLLIRSNYQPWRIETIRDEVHIHEVQLHDIESVTRVIDQIRPDWIFHLAVYGAFSSQTDVQQMLQTNIHGTINLVQACLKTGFEAFVNTGSSSEYGFKDHPPAETEMIEPNSPYAASKAAGTLFCRQTARQQHVHLPTLRLYSVYGPYEDPTRLVSTLIVRGLQGELPPLVGPETARDFVHVADVVEAYLLAATLPGQEPGAIFNVGTSVQTTLREAVAVAREVLNISAEPIWGAMPARSWDTSIWVSENCKICKELAWTPRFNFLRGFTATVEWFRAHPEPLPLYRRKGRPKG